MQTNDGQPDSRCEDINGDDDFPVLHIRNPRAQKRDKVQNQKRLIEGKSKRGKWASLEEIG